MVTIPPRFDVKAEEIDRVVASFYARVRDDEIIGPVFATHVDDWPHHEAKIAGFWRNAILHERSYGGNPMQKHMAAGNVTPDHFVIWLGIFDEVLAKELSQQQAMLWSALAHRIGQGLRYGIGGFQKEEGAVPNLGA